MKYLFIILVMPLLLSSFKYRVKMEPEAQTYLKLYTTVSGTGDSRVENWLLANNGTRRIIATIEIVGSQDDTGDNKERKIVIVEPKASLPLGVRSANGSKPNTVVIVKAEFAPYGFVLSNP